MTDRPDPRSSPPALAPIHDFAHKLRQRRFLERVRAYVTWRRTVLDARRTGEAVVPFPDWAPLSINLDLTTACNFACGHCIDWETLNSGVSYDEQALRASLARMAERGLASVILLGGGEPTVYPRFREIVTYLKELGLHVAVVSNGSRNERILDVAAHLEAHDWVRLSLDAGSDWTFQALHRPKKPIRLEEICSWIPKIKAVNAAPRLGFSFVITWRGAERQRGAGVVENLHEIVEAARLARSSGFDYISFKPFLVRTSEGAEVMDPTSSSRPQAEVIRRIRARLDEARTLATDSFAVLESTNLKLLEGGTWAQWTRQPNTCHMQAFRQVLSPLGLWNCPAHRGVEAARLGGPEAYAAGGRGAEATGRILDEFDASIACREVTCLYHDVNWWLEQAIDDHRGLDGVPPEDGEDLFL